MASVRDLFKNTTEEEEKKQKSKTTSSRQSAKDLFKQDNVETVGKQIQERVSNWITNSKDFFSNANARYDSYDTSSYRNDSSDWMTSISKQKDWFTKEAENIDKLLSNYEKYFDEDWVKSVRESIQTTGQEQEKVLSLANNEIDFWSQWSGAEEYNKLYDNSTYSQKYADSTYEDVQKALQSTTGREKDWLSSNADTYMSSKDAQAEIDRLEGEKKEKTGSLSAVERVKDYMSGKRGEGTETAEIEKRISELKAIRDTAKRKEEVAQYDQFKTLNGFSYSAEQGAAMTNPSAEEILNYEDAMTRAAGTSASAEIEPVSIKNKLAYYRENPLNIDPYSADGNATYSRYKEIITEGMQRNWDALTDDEIQMYNYLLYQQGEEAADRYLDDIQVVLDKRVTDAETEKLQKLITETEGFKGGLLNTGLSIASIPANIIGGVSSFLDNTVHQLKGESINPYSNAQTFRNFANTVRGEVGAEIADNATWNLYGRNVMEGVYNSVMSMGDSVVGASTLGSMYLWTMGSGAAANKSAEVYENGGSDSQILWSGIAAGAAEILTEKVSLDNLIKEKDAATIGGWLREVMKQSGIEASEEVASEIINTVTDGIIMANKSDLSEAIKKYEEGYYDSNGIYHESVSHEEAVKQAYADKVADVVQAGLEGALSGGLSSSVVTGVQTIKNSNALTNTGKNVLATDGGYDALKQLALEKVSASDASIGKYVEKTQKGVDALYEGKVSNRQANKTAKRVGTIAQRVDTARSNLNLSDFETALKNKGMTESEAKKGASILNTILEDGELSRADALKVVRDQRLYDVSKELISASDSSVNSRNGEMKLASILKNASKKSSTASTVEAGGTEIDSEGMNLSALENATERKYEASADGMTINNAKGEVVTIEEIATIKDGKMTLKVKNEDGSIETVDAENVSYKSGGEALIYEAVTHMGVNAVVANSIVKGYNPEAGSVTDYINGYQDAYKYGALGYPVAEMAKGVYSSTLTEKQRLSAYNHGKVFGKENATARQTAINEAKEKVTSTEKATKEITAKKKSLYDGDIKDLNKKHRASIEALEELFGGKARISFYSSFADANGNRVYRNKNGEIVPAPNGITNPDGSISIDLNAGDKGEGLILDAASHELTHHAKRYSPEKYRAFAGFLLENYPTTEGMTLEEEIQSIIDDYADQGVELSPEKALDEFIAKASERMLADIIGNKDTSALEKLAKKDKGLFDTVVEFITDFLDRLAKKIKRLYGKYDPQTLQAQNVRKMGDKLAELRSMWADMVADAVETDSIISRTEMQSLADVGIGFDEKTESVYSLRYSTGRKDALGNVIDLVTVGKKNFNTEAIAELVAKGTGRSIEDARKWVNSEIAIANIVMNHPEFLDFQADDRYESIKKNSDYPQGTVDLSNLCPKRTEFTAMFDMLQKKYPNKLFTANDVAAMRNILKDQGITVACGACFVEDRRQLLGEIADTYIGMWKEAVETGKPLQKTNASGNKVTLTVTKALAKQYGLKQGSEILATDKYIPTQYDLTTYEGFKLLEKNHPTIAMGFNRYNNSRGQQAGRLIEGRAEYNRQILGWSDAKVRSVNNNGGLRIFSFSDFEVVHLLDLVQVILDCSAKGVKIQGYTKIPSFARLVRDTGIKLNRSLIPKGQTGMKTVDGKQVLDYDTTEGIDINDENFINERDNPNVGNILIGINPTQIGIAMLDDFVDYIIPFHTNKSKDICKALGLAEWVNYRPFQTEKDSATGETVKNVNIYTQVINKYHPSNKVEFVDAFLKECKAQKKTPRYSEFLNKEYKADGAYMDKYGSYDFTYREGYHKLLVDFKMFDHEGNILPQGEITPNLDDAFMAELLKAEVDKKQNYEFPQEVYDRLDREFGEEAMYSFRNSKSGMANDALIPYNEEQTRFIKQRGDYIIDSFDKLKEVVNLAFDQPDVKAIAHFGMVDVETLIKIKNSISNLPQSMDTLFTDNRGYSIATTLDGIRHIVKEKNLTRQDVIDYLDRFADTIVEYDEVDFHYYTRRGIQIPGLLFRKDFPDGKYISYDLVSQEKQSLLLQSLYLDGVDYNKKRKSADPLLMHHSAPASTSKTRGGQTSVNRIAQDSDFVNTSDENSYSLRNKDSVSNRALLANALESTVTNEIERKTLDEYKEELGRADALERELVEIRSKIKELSFAKGPKDTEGLRKLREQEIKTVNRIDIRDKKLLRLEATKPLKDIIKREKEKAYKRAEQKGKEALAKYREKTAETQRELLDRWKESRHKAVEGRNKTAMRHKIKSIVSELNQLLLRGTKDKHVMIGLQKAVASALDAVNMDTVGAEERVAKYNALIAKEKNPDIIESLTASRNRILEQGDKLGEKLANLKNAYSDIKNSDDPLIANSYDEVIFSKIESVVSSVGNTALRDMSLTQLEDVYDLYKMVLTTVRNSNKAFKAKKGEEISVLGNRVMEEVETAGGKKEYSLKALEGLKKYGWSILKPVYAFKLIGSKTFSEVFDNVRAGEDTWAKDISEANEYREATTKKYKYKSWDFNKKHTFTSKSGVSFQLTLDQMLSLYAYSKRKQADDHLEKGGFVFDSAIEVVEKTKLGIPVKYTVNTATAHNLSKETLAEIVGNLTTEQKGFVDEMQDYLSTVMGEKGNEVSLAMYGVKLFKEKFYFPLKSARQFMFEQNEVAGEVKIKNAGFSKETVAHANNPIILNNFMDVWANHVNDMSMYHSFVLPLEDFNRVFNYKTPTADNMPTESVKMYLQNAYGTQAETYIGQLLKDLNGGARSDPQAGIINKAVGKFKKASVFASMSVVIQQPSAIGRAFAYVDPKYFVGKKVNKQKQTESWNEVKKYAPIAIIKEMGYFDVGNGRSTVNYLKGDKSIMDRVDDVASWLPAKADEITWCAIWEAVKRETADRNKALKAESDAFLKAVGERFTEVIVNTQVYDSVLSRSGIMRSKDTGVKMATAFMAEPTTTMNMMVDAHFQGKRGNKGIARRIRGGVVASIVINSILVSLVYATRDDDEDETFAEKYLGSLTSELIDGFNPLTYLPYVKDIWSIAQGYDVERSDMSIFSSLWGSVEGLFNKNTSTYDKIKDFTGTVSNLFGLPIKNIWRDVEAMYNVANGILEGTPNTSAGIGNSVMDAVRNAVPLLGRFTSAPSNGQQLYDAILSGDKTQIGRVTARFKDEDAVNTAIRKALRDNDSRIEEAARARMSGDIAEYARIVREITGEGYFSQDLVVGAVNAEINALEKEEGENNPATTEEEKDKATSIYNGDDVNSALESGDTDTATAIIEDLIRVKTENYLAEAREEAEKEGKKFNEKTALQEAEKKAKSSIKGSITSHWKPLYKEAYKNNDTEEMKRIRLLLVATGVYGRASEVLDTVKGWLKD